MIDLAEVCRRARMAGRNGWPPGTAEVWRRVFKAHQSESNMAIARRYGVDRGTVAKARARVGDERVVDVRRQPGGDDRTRITEALHRASATYTWTHREAWTICPGNPGRAISTHGRMLTLADAGAIPRSTRIIVIKDERGYSTSWEVDGDRPSLAHLVLRAFDGPPHGVAARVDYKARNRFGVSMFLRNLRWQEDLEDERAKTLLQALLCGMTWTEAEPVVGVNSCALGKAYRRSKAAVGVTARSHTSASAKRALEVFSRKVDEVSQRRAWLVSSAVTWPGARK